MSKRQLNNEEAARQDQALPDPIARNRRERRLAWLIFVVLAVLAIMAAMLGPAWSAEARHREGSPNLVILANGSVALLDNACRTEGSPDLVILAQAGIQRPSGVNCAYPLDPRLREDDGYTHSYRNVDVRKKIDSPLRENDGEGQPYVLAAFERPRHTKPRVPVPWRTMP